MRDGAREQKRHKPEKLHSDEQESDEGASEANVLETGKQRADRDIADVRLSQRVVACTADARDM